MDKIQNPTKEQQEILNKYPSGLIPATEALKLIELELQKLEEK